MVWIPTKWAIEQFPKAKENYVTVFGSELSTMDLNTWLGLNLFQWVATIVCLIISGSI